MSEDRDKLECIKILESFRDFGSSTFSFHLIDTLAFHDELKSDDLHSYFMDIYEELDVKKEVDNATFCILLHADVSLYKEEVLIKERIKKYSDNPFFISKAYTIYNEYIKNFAKIDKISEDEARVNFIKEQARFLGFDMEAFAPRIDLKANYLDVKEDRRAEFESHYLGDSSRAISLLTFKEK